MQLIYFSSVSGNTARFASKLEAGQAAGQALRLPLRTSEDAPLATGPFILLTPTYGDGNGRNAVPKQVIKFLNVPANRNRIRGVIGTGNTNFGHTYGLAGGIIADKCRVPLLRKVEIFGVDEDVIAVNRMLATQHRAVRASLPDTVAA